MQQNKPKDENLGLCACCFGPPISNFALKLGIAKIRAAKQSAGFKIKADTPKGNR